MGLVELSTVTDAHLGYCLVVNLCWYAECGLGDDGGKVMLEHGTTGRLSGEIHKNTFLKSA